MNLATMTTQAPAVRKHGGGRARRYLLTLLLIGRPTRPNGGEINRRCAAATYSNHLPASCAAAAHPTTGVRRARKPSTPLRSNTRPHAQLVMGYKHSTSASSKRVSQHPNGEMRHLVVVIELLNVFSLAITKDIPITQPSNDCFSEERCHFELTQQFDLPGIKLGDRNGSKSLNVRWPLQIPAIPTIGIDRFCAKVVDSVEQGAVQQPELLGLIASQHQKHLPQPLCLGAILVFLMHVGEGSRSDNRQYGAKGLRPRRALLNAEVLQNNKKSPTDRANEDECPHTPNADHLHPFRHLQIQHLPSSISHLHCWSLPAPTGAVHGDAA